MSCLIALQWLVGSAQILSMWHTSSVGVMQVHADVRYLLTEIYFHCPPLEKTHTILSKVTITPLIFTNVVLRWVLQSFSDLLEQYHWNFSGWPNLAVGVMTRFIHTHIHMYMFCSYLISTLYHLLEELQMRTFKRYFSHAIILTTLHLRDMN